MMSPYIGSTTPHPSSASAGKSPALTMDLSTDIMSRVWVMIILFSVSLFGMSVSPPPPHPMHPRLPSTPGHGLRPVRHFCFRQLAVLTFPFPAAWFPTLSKRIQRIRVPRIVFFIGKHFGTGVILSTAFVHLLQEAFENLQHPIVKAKWGIGKWTGLIVYVSPSYILSVF